jgi:hypothetical protein
MGLDGVRLNAVAHIMLRLRNTRASIARGSWEPAFADAW